MSNATERNHLISHGYDLVEKKVASVFNWLSYAGVFFIVVIMLMTVAHAIGRYALNLPVRGLVELSGFLLTIMIFLSGANTTLEKGHISIGLFIDRISLKKQAAMDIFNYSICLIFVILSLWQTFVQGTYLMGARQLSDILRIPKFPFFYVEGFGWALISLAMVILLVSFVRKAVKK